MIQHFKDKTRSTGVLYLQQTHCNSKVEQRWKENFKGHACFAQGKTNSSGVLSAYFEKETFTAKKARS